MFENGGARHYSRVSNRKRLRNGWNRIGCSMVESNSLDDRGSPRGVGELDRGSMRGDRFIRA